MNAVAKKRRASDKAKKPAKKQVNERKLQSSAESEQDILNRTGFTLRPGDGWLFYQAGREGTFVFQGHIRLDNETEYQVQAKLDTQLGKYDCLLREFGGTWPKVAEFTLPQLGDKSYVEGEVRIPLKKPIEVDGVKIIERKYKIRAFRSTANSGETVLRMRLPQVARMSAQVPM